MNEYDKMVLRRHLEKAARQQEQRAERTANETTAFHARQAAEEARQTARQLCK
jgi:hypothetical protein